MLIQFTKDVLCGERAYEPDDVAEVSDEAAKRLIAQGGAVEFDGPLPDPEPTESAPEKKKRGRPKTSDTTNETPTNAQE